MEWWQELRDAGAAPHPDDLATLAWPPFQFGNIAMYYEGSWATPPIIAGASFAWDIATWPAGPARHSTFSAGSGYAITRDARERRRRVDLPERLSLNRRADLYVGPDRSRQSGSPLGVAGVPRVRRRAGWRVAHPGLIDHDRLARDPRFSQCQPGGPNRTADLGRSDRRQHVGRGSHQRDRGCDRAAPGPERVVAQPFVGSGMAACYSRSRA